MKHKETIEKANLAERKGGYHSSASAELHNPDPKSTFFLPDAERFDRDFVVHEKKLREDKFSKKMQELEKRK